MKVISVLSFLLSILIGINAHICLMEPLQRGGVAGSDKVEAPVCLHVKSEPCGGTTPTKPSKTYKRNTMASITFQKNADHYYAEHPGNVSINVYPPNDKKVQLLSMLDDNAPSLTNFTMNLWIPSTAAVGIYPLEAVYDPNNPNVPMIFRACADIQVE